MTVGECVARWTGTDGEMIGGHHLETVRDELWPWLLERGYATDDDTELLEPFLNRVRKRNRDVAASIPQGPAAPAPLEPRPSRPAGTRRRPRRRHPGGGKPAPRRRRRSAVVAELVEDNCDPLPRPHQKTAPACSMPSVRHDAVDGAVLAHTERRRARGSCAPRPANSRRPRKNATHVRVGRRQPRFHR